MFDIAHMTIYALTHYIIKPWFLPPGLNILLGIIGLIIGRYNQTIGEIIIIISFISLWLFSTPFFAYPLLNVLQDQYPRLEISSLGQTPSGAAIVVLGGGDAIEYNHKHTVSDITLQRIQYAAFLHHKTHLPIIVSGGSANGSKESEADLMAKVLLENFNIKSTLKETESINTADESKLLALLLRQNQIKVIYLVTHAWHMPRSIYIFKKAGITVIPAPMGYTFYNLNYSIMNFLPSINALHATVMAFHEFLGLIWYRLYY